MKEKSSQQMELESDFTVRDRPKIPVAPSLSPFSQKQRRGKPRRNQSKGLKSKFIKDPNPRRKMQLLRAARRRKTHHFALLLAQIPKLQKKKPAQRQHTKTFKSPIGNIESNVCGIHYIGSYESCHTILLSFEFCQLVHEAWRYN